MQAALLDSLSDLPLARKLTEGEIDFEAEGARAVSAVLTGKDNCVRALRDPETPSVFTIWEPDIRSLPFSMLLNATP